jgi:predicted RNA methylase
MTQTEMDRERRNAALRDVAAGAAGGLLATVTAGTGILPALAVAAGTASVVAFLEANKLLGRNGAGGVPSR